ncbi:MAG: hypothetical protein M1821_003391 [Bathelium mastoideum]|nr:MAG: hypothetical protein M1821_003391 [Bathelium mastoideum]
MATELKAETKSGQDSNSHVRPILYQPPEKGWVSYLPSSWVPYVQLTRLTPGAGLWLIIFPHVFGVLHAAILRGSPPAATLRITGILLGGCLFLSNAIHIWNDVVDAPLDAQIPRTATRPIPRGAVSRQAAVFFTATQAIAGLAFFLPLGWESFLWSIPGIAFHAWYPFAKRVTYYPQVSLGLALAWGVLIGEVAMGWDPLQEYQNRPEVAASVLSLLLAITLWPVIYDTVYAHEDVEEDMKVGIKSMAVLYYGCAKPLLWKLVAVMTGLLGISGYLVNLGASYYVVSVASAGAILGVMLDRVRLDDADSCDWWFLIEFWFVGGAITGGLLGEYALRL